ncbi:MAG: hypothetical protein AB7J40_04975 [Candidatus Altimarinota bacterium]
MNSFESAKSESIKILDIVREYHHLTLLDEEVFLIRSFLAGALKKTPQTSITPTCSSFWDAKSSNDRAAHREDLRMIKRNELIANINRLLDISQELDERQIQFIALEISDEIKNCHRSIRKKRRPVQDENSTEPVMDPYAGREATRTTERGSNGGGPKPKYVRKHSARHR